MTLGPGKYDDLTTAARVEAEALGVVLIVIDGKHGSGFSVQATPLITFKLPELLRTMADQIENDLP